MANRYEVTSISQLPSRATVVCNIEGRVFLLSYGNKEYIFAYSTNATAKTVNTSLAFLEAEHHIQLEVKELTREELLWFYNGGWTILMNHPFTQSDQQAEQSLYGRILRELGLL